MTLVSFEPSLPDLIDGLPRWWATRMPASELAILLEVLSEQIDVLSETVEQIAADQALSTAGADALQYQWAHVYGAQQEQLPPTVTALRQYLQARAAEDGSESSLLRTLLSLLQDPANAAIADIGGVLEFPAAGPLSWAADSSGMHWSSTGKVLVIDSPSTNSFTVQVHSGLVYDTAAFARAVDRFRPAHCPPATITVV